MPTTTPLTDAIQALTTYANETTGASDTTLSEAVGTLVAGYGGGGGGTKTYVVKDGVIQDGYSFVTENCTVTEEDGYLFINGNSNNQYQAAYTPSIDVPSGTLYIVAELAEVDGHYGWTWENGAYQNSQFSFGRYKTGTGANDCKIPFVLTTGYFLRSKYVCGVTPGYTTGSIKLGATGDSGHKGFLNVKDLYFVSE